MNNYTLIVFKLAMFLIIKSVWLFLKSLDTSLISTLVPISNNEGTLNLYWVLELI